MLDLVRSAAVPELQWLPLWLGVAELYWVSTSWCGAADPTNDETRPLPLGEGAASWCRRGV